MEEDFEDTLRTREQGTHLTLNGHDDDDDDDDDKFSQTRKYLFLVCLTTGVFPDGLRSLAAWDCGREYR